MQLVRLGIWLLLFFSIFSCRKEQTDLLGDDCSIALKLQADYTEHEMVLTRAGVDVPPVDSFNVRIENTKAEVLKTWKYSELPNLIKVVPGSYKLVAWYGAEEELPIFDRAYYYGERKLTLKDGDNLDTTVIAARAATKVAVAFHESFDFDYTDYFVDIKTEGDSLRFLKDEKRAGYFKPGKLRMRFGLKIKGEDFYREFYPSAIASVKGREFYNFTLKVQTNNGALSGFIISTDSSTIEIPVNVELPPMYLPKKAPVVNLTGEDVNNGGVETNEGIHKKAMFTVSSVAGLTKLKLQTTCPSLVEKGWPAEVNLMELTPEQKTVLAKHGLEWSEELNTKDTIKNMVWVRFDNVVKLMTAPSGSQTKADFTIVANDRLGQSTDSVLNVTVNPPVFKFVTSPSEGNVFARRAIYDIEYQSDFTPVVECLPNGGTWQALETVLNPKDTGTGIWECIGIGLTPNTKYDDIRIRVGERTWSAGSVTTEQELQLPNGNMEQWTKGPGKTEHYFIWSVAGWSTMNLLTTSEGGTNDSNLSPNRDGMAYCATSGTISTTDSHEGGTAALIRSVGWGKGSSAGAGVAGMKKTTAGELYLGAYNDGVAKYGVDFASRPTAIQFYNKYAPQNPNDQYIVDVKLFSASGELIAEGSLKGGKLDQYTLQKVNLIYTASKVRAAKLSVRFVSGTCIEKNRTDFACSTSVSKTFEYVGSQLYIDDIKLIYE